MGGERKYAHPGTNVTLGAFVLIGKIGLIYLLIKPDTCVIMWLGLLQLVTDRLLERDQGEKED